MKVVRCRVCGRITSGRGPADDLKPRTHHPPGLDKGECSGTRCRAEDIDLDQIVQLELSIVNESSVTDLAERIRCKIPLVRKALHRMAESGRAAWRIDSTGRHLGRVKVWRYIPPSVF